MDHAAARLATETTAAVASLRHQAARLFGQHSLLTWPTPQHKLA